MTLKELRDKAAAALKAATDIRDSMKETTGAWPAEKQSAFDAAMADFTKFHKEAEAVQAREAQFSELASAEQFYRAPAQQVPQAGQAAPTEEAKKKAHKEAFQLYLRQGEQAVAAYAHRQSHVAPKEIFALLSTEDTLGGFLVPDDFQAEVIRAAAGFAVIRPLARVQPTTRDTLVWPKVTPNSTDSRYQSGFAGTWQAQGYVTGGTAPTVQNYPTFSQERIPVHDWQPNAIEVSPNLLEDPVTNVEALLAEIIGQTLAIDEDDAFLEGNGVNKPEGIINAGCTTVNTGSASDVTYTGLIDLFVAVPAQYRQNASWMMSSTTYGNILKLSTGTGGTYVIPPNTLPGTLWGKPVAFHEGMDACTTASNKPIVFGNWKYYIIAQRQGLRVQRLVERFAPNIGFLPTARLGGQCVLTDAFRVATVSA